MIREEIEESSRKHAFAEQTRPMEAIEVLSMEMQLEIRKYIYFASRNSYIVGAESRNAEIAELVKAINFLCDETIHYGKAFSTTMEKAGKIIKNYEN